MSDETTKPKRKYPVYQLDKTKYLSDAEYEQLKLILFKYSSTRPRDMLMFNLLLNTGARCQELLNTTTKDVYPDSKSIFIRGIKGSRNREIPLHPWLFNQLYAYMAQLPPDQKRLFPINYNRLRNIWAWYMPFNKKLHSLRHTFAIRLYEKTKDIRLVQRALGHTHLTSTTVYQDYCYNIDDFRRLIL